MSSDSRGEPWLSLDLLLFEIALRLSLSSALALGRTCNWLAHNWKSYITSLPRHLMVNQDWQRIATFSALTRLEVPLSLQDPPRLAVCWPNLVDLTVDGDLFPPLEPSDLAALSRLTVLRLVPESYFPSRSPDATLFASSLDFAEVAPRLRVLDIARNVETHQERVLVQLTALEELRSGAPTSYSTISSPHFLGCGASSCAMRTPDFARISPSNLFHRCRCSRS